jgi:hypothetical protein
MRLVEGQRVLRDEQVGEEEAEFRGHAQHAEQPGGDARALAEVAAQAPAQSASFSAAISSATE